MKLVTRLLMMAFAGVLVVSCLEDRTDDMIERTAAMEQEELAIYLDTLAQRGFDVDTTELGVYYVVDSLGDGPFPVSGDTCTVKYTGFLLGGYIFDASMYHSADSTYQFVLNETPMIEGWNDGVQTINKGTTSYLIIPSDLAYGSAGYYPIRPYETLIFKVEMVEIKQAY
ncbi:FKBP-type peptidyl-prolyl cis-trans isomerase [Maribellus mangrovi]|uniref:FKBP-type peptidyl-prolyl cis-trans isomerase n=1 Tax=Maribellus mangrovi TaxID=3133146 RepID=UPI0030EE0958